MSNDEILCFENFTYFFDPLFKQDAKKQGLRPRKKILVLYQINRLFFWIFWSYIDCCLSPEVMGPFSVPTSHRSQVVGPEKSLPLQ